MTYKIMPRRITAVEVSYDKISESGINVGSPDWFGWLECNRSFHYSCSKGHFTANKNSKGYWYAQRRVRGELLQHYMGQTAKLTLESLLDAAEKLSLAEISERPHNKLTRVLEEQSCKSCMTEEERLRQLSKGELIELVAHLKNQLHDYKTEAQDSSRAGEAIANFEAENEELRRQLNAKPSPDTLLRECLDSYQQQQYVIDELEQSNSELEVTKQALEKQLSERSLQELNEYLAEVGGIPLDDKGKPKARYDQLAKFKTWLESRQNS